MQIKNTLLIGTTAALFILNGCGGGGNESSTTVESSTGFYVDAPLINVNYQCGTFYGTTNEKGAFIFEKGQGCTFFLGNLMIREINASILKENIVIIESDPKVAALLQSIDTVPDDQNKIVIDQEVHRIFTENHINHIPQNDSEREALIDHINQVLGDQNRTYQAYSEEEALNHVKETVTHFSTEIHYLTIPINDDNDEERTDQTPNIPNHQGEDLNHTPEEDNNTTIQEHTENRPENQSTPDTNTTTSLNDHDEMTPPDNDDEDTNTDFDNGEDDTNRNPEKGEDGSTSPHSDNGDTNTKQDNDDQAEKTIIYTKFNDHLYLNEKNDVAIYIADDLNKNEKLIYNNDQIKKITNTIYMSFKDDYDFIFLITNNKERPSTVSYAGVFSKLKNDIEGIGAPIYDNTATYGSNGKLKGVMHFAYRSAILRGPTLHEISHYWANKFQVGKTDNGSIDYNSYVIGKSGHWGYMGFFGGKGQLGGFDANNGELRVEKDIDGSDLTYESQNNGTWKIYSAKDFGWNANGAGRIPYNDLELYLMGFISKNDVSDMIIPLSYGSPLTPDTKEYLTSNNLAVPGRNYFMCREMIRKSWSEIMNDHHIPERKPNYQQSQKHFKILTVLLDTQMPQPYEVNGISLQMAKFTLKGDDGNNFNYNFWEATRGLGTLSSDNLDASLKEAGTEIVIEHTYQEEEIIFHGKVYKTIQSPYTGHVWLDRNIGADHICTSFTDSGCYGGYFQFGRGYDGHQEKNSPTTTEKKATVTPDNNTFVLREAYTSYDWVKDGIDDNKQARIAMVQRTDGSGICPIGFRLPTYDELYDETRNNISWDSFPSDSINGNFLKLPFNGYRNAQDLQGRIFESGTRGAYWTATSHTYSESDTRIQHLLFKKDDFNGYTTYDLATGEAIRCIKEQ